MPAAALGWRLAHGGLGAEGGWPRSLVQQVFSGPQTLWRYLRLWVFPVGLNVDHDVRTVSRAGDPRFWVAALAGVVLVGAVVWGWRRTRLPALALGWFGVGLLPSTAYPLADLVAEHRAYLAGIGLALGAAGGLAALLARWPAGAAALRRRWVPVGLLVLGAALLTVQRNQVWLSDEALWRDAIAKSPRKGRPYNNLAQNLESQNRFQEALRLYRKAITVDPSYYQSYNNLGFLYYRQGNLTAAREMYRKTLELKPELGKTLYNLGQIAQDQGRLEEAIDWYGRALAGNARFLPARTNLAMCRVEQGRYLEAQRLLKEGLQYVPDDPDLHFNLATVYLKRKEWRPAISELETVLRLQPDDVEAYRSLGAVYLFELGNREEGLRYFQRSFQLDPDSPRTREIQRSLGLR